ncbi:MAG: S8 family serine peptidase, partial [Acinetobacter sp.]|nr:S8 family serine peptidase [Acinetobacter sp.]
EEVIKEDDKKDLSFKITEEDYSIALIDTGVPKSEKNVEVISMLGDEGYDEHGHGTSMLESIRKQDKDAKILSIKALDKNGYSDAATIYAAIKYAIERKVNVINLSISGFATEGNKRIEEVTKEAVKQGIIVVGAAGNDNLPASAFIPGGIDEIIVVGACNENNERKPFSNYGITVDYYANASSTSQASAIITGTISANKGDVKKLDDTFFKTPDLSIFDDDLKKRNMPMGDDESLPTNEDDCYDWGSLGRELTDEEFLLLQLRDFVDNADFRVAALNASLHETKNPKSALKDAYKGGLYFAVDRSLIKRSNVSVSELDPNNAQGWTTKAYNTGDNHGVKFNAAAFTDDDPHKGVAGYDGDSLFVVLPLSSASSATLTKPGCYITIKSCVRGSDGNIYDWVIGLGDVTFKWTTNTAADVKQSRSDLVAFQIKDGTLPLFIAGAVNHSTGPNDTSHAAYKVDAALETYFTLGVTNSNGSPVGGTLITGFKDLDQWQLFPTGQKKKVGDEWVPLTAADRTGSNSIDESLEIRNVNELASKDIWVKDNTKLGVDNSGSAGILVSSTQRTQKNETSVNGNTATVYFGMNAMGSTNLHWQGARCRTEIGLSYSDVLEPSTIITYVDFQDPDGQYRNNLEVNRDTQYAGTAYS